MKNILDKYLTNEEYSYTVDRLGVVDGGSGLRVYITMNFVLPFSEIENVKREILNKVDGFSKVSLVFNYVDLKMGKEEALAEYFEYLMAIAEAKYGAIVNCIKRDSYEFSDDEIRIGVVSDSLLYKLTSEIAPMLERLVCKAFGWVLAVSFYYDESEVDEMLAQIEQENENAAREASLLSSNSTKKNSKYVSTDNDAVWGKNFNDSPVPMNSFFDEGDMVVVAGDLVKVETRETKQKKLIVKIIFSDKTDTMCTKIFTEPKKWLDVQDKFAPGVCIKVMGKREFDPFDNEMVIKNPRIVFAQKELRHDDAQEKRVELHAHTKMSSMDGLNDPKALVKQAIAWGQPAVAITDHGVVQSFPDAASASFDKEGNRIIKVLLGLEGYLLDDDGLIDENGNIDYKARGTYHIVLIAKNLTGLRNLYKLVSISHIKYFYKKPRIPRSALNKYREGIILGSACEAGEVFRAVVSHKSDEELEKIASFYDYLEVQPICNNHFLIAKGLAKDEEELKDFNRKVIALGKKLGKPVVATTDAHYGDPEDAIFRNVIMAGQGYEDLEGGQGLYLRTTDEMLKEFDYLDEDLAREIVIDNTQKVADMCDYIDPVPKEKCPPEIENAEEILRDTCEKNLKAKYGDNVPDIIRERLDKELNSIIGNGYAVMYVAAMKLVSKSLSDGYLVGSRGSVGSSFAATMSGITEVNPLPPHYVCPKCKHLEWGDEKEYDCGVDMPELACPECGAPMDREGYTIPFETFLGFYGDKEPDIDLNFAGDYQHTAHKYVDEIFGAENVFKAGTIGTLQDKTVYGFAKKYALENDLVMNKYEIERVVEGCVGVKRTTGQHPGGIVITPRDHEIFEFCPVQRPANDTKSDIITTHFDYHKIDQNLLKLDILGHEVPSMIRKLQDITGMDPLKVPLSDKNVMAIFNGISTLNIVNPSYKFTHGSYGIPEFGTKFVRQMLDDTKPQRFADLVRISGFSHGTDVWLNNAQRFIKEGIATMKEVISTRDDIMNYLILKGVPKGEAFQIMEKVRKGKGVTDEREALMKQHDVPDWYIESCRLIKYMFPRAHAVAYVMMSYRMAYYKVYYPQAFYAVFLTSKIADFNWDVIKNGPDACLNQIKMIEAKGKEAEPKEIAQIIPYEICYEMFSRGIEFEAPSFEHSKAVDFAVRDGKVVVSLAALNGIGANAAEGIMSAAAEHEFDTIEDIKLRGKANTAVIEAMRKADMLKDLPETLQISFF